MTTASPLAATTASAIVDAVLGFIEAGGCSDEQFDALALRLFAYQFAQNEPYRRFCQGRGATPRNVRSWRDIPAVPIDAFKQLTLRVPAARASRTGSS